MPNGWRKPTPGLARADRLARTGEKITVEKGRAIVAVKRIAAHVGIKATDMLLLDTLCAFTKPQDWEEGRRPIVWASNAYLMAQTGFSLSALKRHARRLAEIGVISFKDSPNGKRWGHRDADGVIVEAYGFDLSPLAARVDAFEQLHADLTAERTLCKQLKRQITVARRMIRARIETAIGEALRGPWVQIAAQFEDLLGALALRNATSSQLSQLLSGFNDLQEKVEAAYAEATELVENGARPVHSDSKVEQQMNPKGIRNDPHIRITNDSHITECNCLEKERAGAGTIQKSQSGENVPDIATVVQACPEFLSWARNLGGYLKDWADLHRVAGELRPMIGISENAWNAAQDKLGLQMATAALVLVFDKHAAGEVASPGGYLRGMVEKGRAGELHLARSFYGRLREQAA